MSYEFVGMPAGGRRQLEESFSQAKMLLSANVAQAIQQGVAGGGRLQASAFVSATAGVAAALKLTDVQRRALEQYNAEPASASVDDPGVTLCSCERSLRVCIYQVRTICHVAAQFEHKQMG
jgi:hypothetical protein